MVAALEARASLRSGVRRSSKTVGTCIAAGAIRWQLLADSLRFREPGLAGEHGLLSRTPHVWPPVQTAAMPRVWKSQMTTSPLRQPAARCAGGCHWIEASNSTLTLSHVFQARAYAMDFEECG